MSSFQFKILFFVFTFKSCFCFSEGARDVVTLPLPQTWGKLIKHIDARDSVKVAYLLSKTGGVLSSSCSSNVSFIHGVNAMVRAGRTDSAKILFLRLLLTSIVYDVQVLSEQEKSIARKRKLKSLFAELLAVKFYIIKYDFVIYQTLVRSIRTLSAGGSLAKGELSKLESRTLYTKQCANE